MNTLCQMTVYESQSFIDQFLNSINSGHIPVLLNKHISEEEKKNILRKISIVDHRFDHGRYFIMCTSGTTGYTKLVVHSYDNLIQTGKQFAKILNATQDDVFFSAAKMFHAYGIGNSFSIPNSVGASVIYCDELVTPKLACDIIDRGVTVFCGVPRHFASMVNTNTYPKSKSLRICLSAGEKLPTNIKQEFEKNTGVEIIDAIGSTEMLGFMIQNGKKIDEVDLKIVDEQLYAKSDSMFLGYYNDESFNIEDGWLKTGDLYEIEDGLYKHKGRLHDLVKINGTKIYTNIVEQEILTIAGVKECALKLYKTSRGLDKLKLYLVCDNYLSIKDSILKISEKHRTPFAIEIINELPRTATGKIRKYKLL